MHRVRPDGDTYRHVLRAKERHSLVRPVKTATVSSQSVILKDFSGMVEAVEYVKLAFRVSGQIIDLPVVEGQKGQERATDCRHRPAGYFPAICRRQGCL